MSSYSFCSVTSLRDGFADLPWKPLPDKESIVGAAREACELGRRAYDEAIPGDAASAERLLYFIHRTSAFASPVPAVPATICAILVQAKLEKLLPASAASELEAEDMAERLERGVLSDGTHTHPLLDDLAADTTLRGYRVFLKNWYAMASGFTEFLVSVAQRATPAMQRGIVENLSDELFDETPHIDLRARVLEGAGTHFDAVGAPEDPDIVTETFSLINWRAAASALSNPCLALGLFYSIEANWQFECKRHYAALKALGISDDYLTSLALHSERDEDHAGEWLTMVRNTVASPRDRAAVVRGLSVELAVRRQMYDAIRRYLYNR
jgi:pyrroloquinoline quinone (PQQ) biosynthesis protein C